MENHHAVFVGGALTLSILFIAREIIRLIGREYWKEPWVNTLFRVDRILEDFFGFPIIPTIIGIVLFICMVLLLSQGTIRQINHLMEGTKRLAKGELDQEIIVSSNDELGQMATQINQMAKRLKLSLAEERMAVQSKNELISNVSHDLRTPSPPSSGTCGWSMKTITRMRSNSGIIPISRTISRAPGRTRERFV